MPCVTQAHAGEACSWGMAPTATYMGAGLDHSIDLTSSHICSWQNNGKSATREALMDHVTTLSKCQLAGSVRNGSNSNTWSKDGPRHHSHHSVKISAGRLCQATQTAQRGSDSGNKNQTNNLNLIADWAMPSKQAEDLKKICLPNVPKPSWC